MAWYINVLNQSHLKQWRSQDSSPTGHRRRSDLKSGGTEKFRLAPSALATCMPSLPVYMGAHRKNSHTIKRWQIFGGPKWQTNFIAIFFDSFRSWYNVCIESAGGASKNFIVFCRTAAYDVICFQIPGEGASALLLLSVGVHGRILTTPNKRLNWNSTRIFFLQKIVPKI